MFYRKHEPQNCGIGTENVYCGQIRIGELSDMAAGVLNHRYMPLDENRYVARRHYGLMTNQRYFASKDEAFQFVIEGYE